MRHFCNAARLATVSAMLVNLAGCGEIGYQVNPGDDIIGGTPPPSVPSTPNPPPPAVPPLSTNVQDLSDGHAVGQQRWYSPQTDGSPIGRFTCVVNPPQELAFRAHLSIIVNNEPQKVPLYLGASPRPPTHCFFAIHTHDSSGRIHVTPAAPGIFTLGELFQIWGQPLSNTNVAGFAGLPVEVYVTDNGTTVKVEDTEWASIELRPHREITIGLGTPLTEIPNFIWSD